MAFLTNLWKKFARADATPEEEAIEEAALTTRLEALESPDQIPDPTEDMKDLLALYKHNEAEMHPQEAVFQNLTRLKEIVDHPPEESPEMRFTHIKHHLNLPECHETIRQERWHPNIHCPSCQSTQIKRLAQLPPEPAHNHRYRCSGCGREFNDDTDTPFERELPPIHIWMQCWYLLGCTHSVSYIASALGLDIPTTELMIRQLQKIFNAQQPLTHFLAYEEWSKQAKQVRIQLKEDLLKRYELLNANVSTAPKDTAEFRRQQNIRRDLKTHPAPPGSKR